MHPGAGHEDLTLVHGLLYRFNKLAEGSSIERPGIVHRLDKETSGLMIIAKNEDAYKTFVSMFKDRKIKKKYFSIVHGNITEMGVITNPIGRSHTNRLKMAIDVIPSKEAYTKYIPVINFGKYCLLDISIKTGRTHQIRVHMSSINHSVVGDKLYGQEKRKSERHFLHSYYLSFYDPWLKEEVTYTTGLPMEFIEFIDNHGGNYATYIG